MMMATRTRIEFPVMIGIVLLVSLFNYFLLSFPAID